MTLGWVALLLLAAAAGSKSTCNVDAPTRALLCHVGSSLHASFNPCLCSHVIFPNQDFQEDVGRLKAQNPKLKVLFKQSEATAAPLPAGADGFYISLEKQPSKDAFPTELKELASKLDDLSSAKRAKAKYEGLNDENGSDELEIILEIPAEPKRLAKHYDIKSLAKYVSYFVVPSDNLTDSSQDGLAYHPSRLMGIDDILNADSLVDLLSSMGADHDKLIISLPAYGLQFTLKDDKNNMPGSPVSDVPVKISQTELCKLIGEGGWTLEREEDMTAPYAYKGKKWVSFDDATSASIKGKYVLLRNLGGLSVSSSEDDDWAHSCAGRPLVDVLHHTLTNLARKSRAAQLLSLQDQIHNSLLSSYSGDVQLSPFRIVRVVDRAGSVHVVRKEAKTEFQCSRQGYFTHPSGCNRFYRCVKFNQYSSDFTVFEYDCPAGLAFDERYEVCVWPGSLPDASACKGSSEIAPVPRSRFACSQEGYYADPENCRWFFACLDHQRDGRTPPTAYEFRCPFGLVFDNEKLACDWPWKVAGCGSGQAAYATVTTGTIYPGDILEGRLRPSYAHISDAQVSGGRIPNVEGGLVLGTSLLSGISNQGSGAYTAGSSTHYGNGYGSGNLGAAAYGSDGSDGQYIEDNSGAYVHDPSGDSGGEYLHQEGAQVPYIHQDGAQVPYVHQSDSGSYKHQGDSGAYVHQSDRGSYRGDGAYVHQGDSGAYRGDGSYAQQGDSGAYRGDGSGAYIHQGDNGAYKGDGSYVQQGDNGEYRGEGAYIQQGDSGSYKGNGEGAYILQGEGGAYRGEGASGSGGSYSGQIYSGANKDSQGQVTLTQTGGAQLATGGAYLAGGLVKSQLSSSGGSSSGAYLHDTRGDFGGAYSHDGSGDRGSGYTQVSGSSGVIGVSGGAAYVSNNAGSYVKTGAVSGLASGPVGISSGTYTLGSSHSSDVKTAGVDSGAYLGGIGYVSGSKTISGYSSSASGDQSGAYVHDSRGDSGGEYIHQDAGYIHQEGAQVPYIHQSDNGAYIHQGDSGAYRYDGAYKYQGDSGAYIHDDRGDGAGYYGGKYNVGQGAYNAKTNLYQGSSNIYGSGAYVHDIRGDNGGAYNQAGFRVTLPVKTHGLEVYHQSLPIIHGQDASRLNIQSVGYIQPAVKVQPITVTAAPAVPLKTVQYIQPAVSPVVATTPVPSVIGYQYRKPVSVVQPISVSSTPAVPLSPVQYVQSVQKVQPLIHQTIQPVVVSTPAPPVVSYGYKTPAISTLSVPTATLKPVTVSNTPVQYVTSTPAPSVHVDTQRIQPVQGYSYTKPSVRYETPIVSYQQPIQTVHLSTPAPLSQRVQPVSQVVYSTPSPTYVSSTVRPITVSSTPVVPLNPVQYNVPCTNCAVSQTARPLTVTATPVGTVQSGYSHTYTHQQQPICTSCATAQTARPITVTSAPVVPLNPVQYSTPAPAVVGYSYRKPAIKFETPVVQQTYTYKQPAVQQTYTIRQPIVQQTYTYKQPALQPIAVSTPAPPVVNYSYQKPAQPVVYSTPSPVFVSTTVSPITVAKTPVVPLNPVQYVKQVQPVQISTAQPSIVGYSYPKPAVKFESHGVQPTYTFKQPTYTYKQPVVQSVAQPIEVTTASPPVVQYTYKQQPLVQQTYTYKQPVVQSVVQPIAVTTASPPVSQYTYKQQPIVQQTYTYKQQPIVQQTYTYKQPVVQQTYTYKEPIVQPVAVSTPAPPVVSYSYQKPAQPIVYSTPAPTYVSSTVRPITVSSTPVVPLNPVQYVQSVSTPAPSVVSYSYPKPAVKFETPVVQQSVTYKQPIVQQTYTYKQPVVQQTYSYKQPVVQQTYTYKQQPVVQQTYTYKQPVVEQTYTYKEPIVQPVAVSTPAPPVVSYSYQKPAQPIVYSTQAPAVVSTTAAPITVSSTPVVPLNPVQYVKPTYVSTPSPPVVSYTYQKPEYKTQPIQAYNTIQYQQPIYKVTTPAPPVVISSTPGIPLNPVQYKVPVQPAVVSYQQSVPTHAPSVVSYQPIKSQPQYVQSKPIVEYSYVQQTPVSYSYPKPAVRLETPVVVSTPAPAVAKYEQQYIKQVVSSPAPAAVSYSYSPAKLPTVAPITVSSTPAIPYSPVQYVRPASPRPQVSYSYVNEPSPAPAVLNYEPLKVVTTPAPPVVNYSYKPVSPAVVSTPAPAVNYYQPVIKTQTAPEQYVAPVKIVKPVASYNYVKPQPFAIRTESQGSFEYSIRQQPIQPAITVTSTPAVPLAPVQYVSTVQPKPIYSYSYVKPTVETPAPVVTETYRVTTPRPAITVTSTPAIPLAPIQYVRPATVKPIYNYNYVKPTTTYTETNAPIVQTYKVTAPNPVVIQTSTEQPFVEYKPVRVRPAVQKIYVPAEPAIPVRTSQQPVEYTIKARPITTTEQPLGVSYYEEYFDSKKTEGYEYKKPIVQLKEERVPVTSTIDYGYQGEVHSSSFAPIVVPEISTAVPARRRPVQTYVNTVEEESYYSSTPGSIDVHDENLNVHLDIPRVGVQVVSSTTPEQVVEVTSVAPAVKRVRVGGSSNVAGGYYVRKQKVRVRPVVTTTENYPAFFTTTVKPVYSSTVDLTSPTLYSTTFRPTYSTTYRPTSTTADAELEVEGEDDSKLIQEVSGGFGSVLTSGDSGLIRQGSVSSTTLSSLKDGEAIVGVVKKEREQFTGRRRTKVVVVSRLSDFNPLLVGKLGAECSCKSDTKTLDLTRTRTRGGLFRPATTTTVAEPSREYLPTSTTPLPDDLTNFDYDDARPPSQIVEIKPVRKTQRVYTTTGTPLDVSTVEYVSSTRPARKIASASASSTKSNSGGRSSRLDPDVDCQRPGLFRHPHLCNKFYSCNWDEWKKRYTVSVFNCPIHLAFDSKLGACNWPSKGPACAENNLLV